MPRGNDRRFTEKEVQVLNKYFYIDCDWIKSDGLNNSREICPIHKRRHQRLPDVETFKYLFELYPYMPMQAWADAFFVTREAVRLLHDKAFGISYRSHRSEFIFGSEPDMDLLTEFFSSLVKKPHMTATNILDWLGMSQAYISYWIQRNEEISESYEKALEDRNNKKLNPDSLKCYRCHIRKPVSEFHNSKQTKHGYSSACKDCSRHGVQFYNEKRRREFSYENIASEKKCSTCKIIKHRSHFHISKVQSGGLQSTCIQCANKAALSHPKRKKKFADAGFTEDILCEMCYDYKEPIYFYLVTPDPFRRPDLSHVSKHCRDCVKKTGEEFGFKPVSFANKYRNKSGDFGRVHPKTLAKNLGGQEGRLLVDTYSWQEFLFQIKGEEE